jgi:hypothetical protein
MLSRIASSVTADLACAHWCGSSPMACATGSVTTAGSRGPGAMGKTKNRLPLKRPTKNFMTSRASLIQRRATYDDDLQARMGAAMARTRRLIQCSQAIRATVQSNTACRSSFAVQAVSNRGTRTTYRARRSNTTFAPAATRGGPCSRLRRSNSRILLIISPHAESREVAFRLAHPRTRDGGAAHLSSGGRPRNLCPTENGAARCARTSCDLSFQRKRARSELRF